MAVVEAAGDATDDAVWLVDGSDVARGLDAWVTMDAGQQTATLRLGKRGGSTSVSVLVTR